MSGRLVGVGVGPGDPGMVTAAARDALLAAARANGHGELFVPKSVLVVEKVPLLATGKVDYPAVQALAAERVGG